MHTVIEAFLLSLPRTLTSAVDILAVAFLIYQFFMIIRGRRAVSIIVGIVTLVAVYASDENHRRIWFARKVATSD